MSRATPTVAEQRLNSAHGRLVHAAWRVPARSRYLPARRGRRSPIEVVAHLLEFQDEALRRLYEGSCRHDRQPGSSCDGELRRGLRRYSWEVLLESLEIGHLELCRLLHAEPPSWFGELTYDHYARHRAELEAWHAAAVLHL
jgi:hypothetical protein